MAETWDAASVDTQAFEQATALIDAATTVAVVGHVHPDADAVGSVCAVVRALQQRGIAAVGMIGQAEPLPSCLLSIPGASEVRTSQEAPRVDAVVVVDCASVTRAGTHAPLVEALSDACVVVDHHATNPGFGAVNLIDVGAESTTTVLLSWFKHMGIHMDTPLATALYAGLVTDTGNFRWGRPAMHTMAAELIRLGVDTRATTAALMDERSVEDLALIGKVLQRVERIIGEKTTIVAIFADYDVIADEDPSMVESMVTFVCSPKDAQVGALFKEYAPGVWSVSLRSSTVDVAAVASRFGGGGHVCASGYTTQGDWHSVKASLAETLDTI